MGLKLLNVIKPSVVIRHKGETMNKSYQDIIDLPYQKSTRHPHMARIDRAAQFAPFAALTGHKEAIKETARITEEKRILDENKKFILNNNLQAIISKINQQPLIKVVYFQEDKTKQGGKYLTIIDQIKKVDEYNRVIILVNSSRIRIDDIYEIELSDQREEL